MSFDLFEGLAKLSSGDRQWFDRLPDEDKKAAAPFVIMRWMTGTADEEQVLRLNTFVNPYVFSLGQEKGLLFKLLTAAATGRNKRYQWLKGPTSKQQKLKHEAVKQFYDYTDREASLSLHLVSAEDAIQMAEELGWDNAEITKLKKEVADGSGSAEKPSGKKKK